mmetsp:Transcript_120669/g.301056  ORF Transcript_120669/g.301056 Transcript_120669/m.301056 type:complete len:300 (+) Transcript_120669:466-1365(+)
MNIIRVIVAPHHEPTACFMEASYLRHKLLHVTAARGVRAQDPSNMEPLGLQFPCERAHAVAHRDLETLFLQLGDGQCFEILWQVFTMVEHANENLVALKGAILGQVKVTDGTTESVEFCITVMALDRIVIVNVTHIIHVLLHGALHIVKTQLVGRALGSLVPCAIRRGCSSHYTTAYAAAVRRVAAIICANTGCLQPHLVIGDDIFHRFVVILLKMLRMLHNATKAVTTREQEIPLAPMVKMRPVLHIGKPHAPIALGTDLLVQVHPLLLMLKSATIIAAPAVQAQVPLLLEVALVVLL